MSREDIERLRQRDRLSNALPRRPRTLVLPLPGEGVTRQDYIDGLGSMGIEKTGIRCIQWTTTGVIVTLEDVEERDELLKAGVVQIAGRSMTVQDSERSLTYVTIFDAPQELPDGALKRILSKYGRVRNIRRQMYRDTGIETGIRTVRMKLLEPIPSYIRVGEMIMGTKYPNQQKTCRKCDSVGHIARNCHLMRCNNCAELGHKEVECEKELRCSICTNEAHLAKDCKYNWSPYLDFETMLDTVDHEPREHTNNVATAGGMAIQIPTSIQFGHTQPLSFGPFGRPAWAQNPAEAQGTDVTAESQELFSAAPCSNPNTEAPQTNAARSLLQELEQTALKNTDTAGNQNDMETDAKSVCSKRTRTSSLSSDEDEHANDGSTSTSESTMEEPVTPKKAVCDKAPTEVEKENEKEKPEQQQPGRHNMPKQMAPPQWLPREQKKKKKAVRKKHKT